MGNNEIENNNRGSLMGGLVDWWDNVNSSCTPQQLVRYAIYASIAAICISVILLCRAF